jgi:hypothetical protein
MVEWKYRKKKGDQNFPLCVHKLLKTNARKMPDFASEQKLMKTKVVIIVLRICC